VQRRAFLVGTGAVFLAAPLAAEAQQPGKIYRVGILLYYHAPESQHLLDAFRQALRELG